VIEMNELTRKQYSTQVREVSPGARTMRFVVSTAGVDRDNDTVSADGWLLDNFKRNPTILWAHNYDQPPIGRAQQVTVERGNLVAVIEFVPPEIYEFAGTIYQMLKAGFLNATSVGFRPKKAVQNTQRGGTDFVEQELLEISIVPVPANADALVVGRSIDREAVAKWLGVGRDELVLDLVDEDVVLDVTDWQPVARAVRDSAARRRSEPYEPVFDIDPAMLAAAVRDVVPALLHQRGQHLRNVIANETAAAMRRATGRVD
jgi:HK97 family phage prohead protease